MFTNTKNPILPYILFLLSLLWYSVGAQGQVKDSNNVVIKVKKVEKQKDDLLVSIDFDFGKLELGTREQLILKPILKQGENKRALTPIIINGRIRHKAYLRHKDFESNSAEYEYAKVMQFPLNPTQNITSYIVTVPFEEWMSNASLYLQESVCQGCGVARPDPTEFLLSSMDANDEKYKLNPLVTFVMPDNNYSEKRSNPMEAYLKFPVGSSIINPLFMNNTEELNKLNAVIENLIYDKKVSVSKISIQGLASIEGSYQTNMRLSEGRAKAFKTYIQNKYGLPSLLFNVSWVGEDWDGLRLLVEKGNMPQKERILSIINSVDVFDGREKQLMRLDEGVLYQFMLAYYFPLLRKVKYTIEYTVNEFNEEECLEIFKNHPEHLSPAELYRIAEKYEKLSDEFKNIMDISILNYPTDIIVNNNAAATYIIRAKYDIADLYLMSAGNSAPTFNNKGVIFMMRGEYKEAEDILLKAKQLGSKDAEHNLKELEKVKHTKNE